TRVPFGASFLAPRGEGFGGAASGSGFGAGGGAGRGAGAGAGTSAAGGGAHPPSARAKTTSERTTRSLLPGDGAEGAGPGGGPFKKNGTKKNSVTAKAGGGTCTVTLC